MLVREWCLFWSSYLFLYLSESCCWFISSLQEWLLSWIAVANVNCRDYSMTGFGCFLFLNQNFEQIQTKSPPIDFWGNFAFHQEISAKCLLPVSCLPWSCICICATLQLLMLKDSATASLSCLCWMIRWILKPARGKKSRSTTFRLSPSWIRFSHWYIWIL